MNNISSELFLFADDAKLFGNIAKQLETIDLQQDLDELYEWIFKSLLTLNIFNKCNIVSCC